MIQKQTDNLPASLHAYPARGLVVEDSRAVRTMVCRFLSSRHVSTREAADGLAAWDLLQRAQFDVVITDIEMPFWTGLELVTAMRHSADEWIRNTPVIVTSTVTRSDVCEAAREFRSTYFMSKPLVVAQLDVMLRMVATMQRHGQRHWAETQFDDTVL
jgi:CheY-like chemotaxis protein